MVIYNESETILNICRINLRLDGFVEQINDYLLLITYY